MHLYNPLLNLHIYLNIQHYVDFIQQIAFSYTYKFSLVFTVIENIAFFQKDEMQN